MPKSLGREMRRGVPKTATETACGTVGGKASRPAHIGDWLLLDSSLEPPPPRRSGPWRPIFDGGSHVLYAAEPGPCWVGAPWREHAWRGGRAWLWGESAADGETIARLARGGDASELGGRFLLLSYLGDPPGGRFEVTTDRFGTLHAYAARDGRAVSSCFAAASAQAPRKLDWQGLAAFFAAGFFLGERTFWQHVRCLGPARRHQPGAGSERYWHWRHEPLARSRGETADAFAEVFETVVGDSLASPLADPLARPLARPEGVALPLSGGLDSRALAAAAPPGSLAWSYGYGYQRHSAEIRIAGEIAARRRLPFDGLVIEPYLDEQIDLAFDLLEGFQDLTQSRQLAALDRLAERADVVLAGHWGDVWLDDMGVDEQADVAARAAGKLLKRGGDWLLEKLCRPRVDRPSALFAQQVAEGLGEYSHLREADFRLKAFKTDHWSCRWTLASVRAYQAAAFPRLPFYDPRLSDFFATVPAGALRDRRLEIDYLRRRAPELARIPWQETGAGLHRSRRAAWWLGLPRRAAARAWRIARGRRVIERNWEVQLLGSAGRRLLDRRLLRPGLRLHDMVDPRDVRALVDELSHRPTAASGYTVSMLLTFAVFLERH